MEGVTTGNASTVAAEEQPKYKFWIIGQMIDEYSPRHTGAFEVKWGTHLKGENYPELLPQKEGVTAAISILISGKMRLQFKNGTETQDVILETQGDFALWEQGVSHNSAFLEDTLVLTIKWPSVPNKPGDPPPHNTPGLTE